MIETSLQPMIVINKVEGTLAHIDNYILEKEILAKQERLHTDSKHTKYEDMVLDVQENTQAKQLIDSMCEIGESLGCTLDGYWKHVHRKYESSEYHDHSSEDKDIELSWVYYVKAEENCGDLVFNLDIKDSRIPIFTVIPKEGNFIIFPSFLLHKVSKNLSDSLRISVAGDYIPFGKRGAHK